MGPGAAMAAVFIVDDTAILESVQRKVYSIHSELLSTLASVRRGATHSQ